MTSRILEAAVGRVEVDNRHSATLAAYQTQMAATRRWMLTASTWSSPSRWN